MTEIMVMKYFTLVKEEDQKDQPGKHMTKHWRGNLDLSKNKYNQEPLRVIRGANHFEKEYASVSGYRYDGLYYVEDYYPDTGEDGFRIWRYKLVKEPNTELPPSRNQDSPT